MFYIIIVPINGFTIFAAEPRRWRRQRGNGELPTLQPAIHIEIFTFVGMVRPIILAI